MSKKRLRILSGKGSQISAFILLALVILTIFLFVFYIRNQIRVQRAEGKIDKLAEILQQMPALNYYVDICLKDSVENALILVGKQGGNIYAEQGGPISRNSVPIFKYKDNITYGLTSIDSKVTNAQSLLGGPSYPLPPGYPCIKAIPPISYMCPYDFLSPARFYPFSQDHLPLLCISGGPNDVDVGIYPFPCPSGSYGPDSIQEQIKVFAEKRMQNCTNFTAIKQLADFNITAGIPVITPIMGENDVIAKASYPINITVDGVASVRLIDFEVKVQVRLKKMYGVMRFLVDNDKSYLDFNITKDFDSDVYTSPHWDPYIRVSKFCPKCNLEGDESDTTDILQINDSASNIKGNDFIFRFAIENRIPALEFIRLTVPESEFDYIVQEGEDIVIDPLGYDPDDNDDLFYSYLGWKQDYDEVFDPSCCNEISPDSSIICKDDLWACVKKVPVSSLDRCMDDYTQEDTNVWTTSQLYLVPNPGDPSNTYRSANYIAKTTDSAKISSKPGSEELNPVYYPCIFDEQAGEWKGTAYSRDLGPHNVTVKVCDRHGKCDWQSILIMVTDIPRPVIGIRNDYGTEDASLEDPFNLDASKSNIFALVNSYIWKDTVAGVGIPEFEFTVPFAETQNGRVKIPHPSQNIDIKTIKGANNFFRQKGQHTLSLTIGSQTETKDIDVKECIPFTGTGNAYDPFPYNPHGSDPFFAKHSCCSSDGTYSPTTTRCYDKGEYGAIIYLDSKKYTANDDTLSIYPVFWHLDEGVTQTEPSLTGNYGNDIFFRKFERFCSGDRGNTCTGLAQEDLYMQSRCNDIEYAWQDERCEGPAPPGIFETATGAVCIDYAARQTFESVEGVQKQGGGQVNGFCSDTTKCTNGIDYSINGPFQCQRAVCDKGHCTKPYTTENLKCMCNTGCGASSQCLQYSYDDLKDGGLCLPDRSGFCTSSCSFIDPDVSASACTGCNNVWNVGGGTEINVDAAKCCGNEPSEHYLENIYDNTDACCDNKDSSGNLLSGDECVINGICQDRIPSIDICNGIDDDCNSVTQDGSGETNPVNTLQNGICKNSLKSCFGSAGWQDDYSGVSGYQISETLCNDNLDNDCDGWIDCQDSDCSGDASC